MYASDPKFIAQNLTAIANSLRKVPIPVKTNISYGLVDWDLLHSTVFSALYQPYTTFYPLAQSLAELAKGNAKPFYQLSETPGFSCDCSTGTGFSYPTQESGSFVICSDGGPLPRGLKFAKFYYHEMDTIAPWGGGIMSLNFLDCTGWPKFRRTNFQGPFSATTNFPILLIGNTADPVTPLRSARKMSAGFKNSVLLRQDSAGHTSLSSPSSCTLQMIQDYFVNGLLPDENTVCAIDGSPWPNLDEEMLAAKKSLSPKQQELLRISRKLSRVFKVPRLA
ncbi:hypothetical protein BDN72DRAFT_498595 [Pluteus cervinus]|uniref:Uncharacterized protein n=1 Tax=Pluteus cervinus TaxID=181527 RepID=A0ACD3AYL5_9AGAR|nr:hypothetical protein BDN72DRAFT_498595 [Pluteus cervinus]